MEKKREPGQYWVKINGSWSVAYCYKSQLTHGMVWIIQGRRNHVSEADKPFDEIDERPITREHGKE